MICNIRSTAGETVLDKFTTENLVGSPTVDGAYPVMNTALFDQANQEMTEELYAEYGIINKFFTRTGNYAVFHSSTGMLVDHLEKNPTSTPFPSLLQVKGTVDRALSFLSTIDEGRLKNGILQKELPITISPSVMGVLQRLADSGHKAMVVGGAVRDALLGKDPKDIDIEVYNISYTDLEQFLSKIGKTNVVGKAFGIIKFTDDEGNEFDFSIPRRESKTGVGHTGFNVEFDSTMSPKEAARRRDFTWNGLAYDVLGKEIHDYFGGIKDLKENIIRHTSEQFTEDPLRILRAMQFQARMGLDIDPSTMALMRQMVSEGALDNLSKERITEEWMKWATKASYPSKIFNFLLDIGLSSQLPHIGALKGVQQEADWHPEGDVEVHTGFVMNEAAKIADREGLTGDDRAVLIFSALTHDFAKPATTEVNIVRGVPRITSRGHEEAGGKLAEEFLKSIGVKQSIIDRVVPLVMNHLAHVSIAQIKAERGKVSATKKLAVKLKDSNISELLLLIEADASGRPPLPKGLPQSGVELRDLSQRIGVSKAVEKPIMSGAYLIESGMSPGRELGDILRQAAAAQENGEFSDVEGGKKWIYDNFGIQDKIDNKAKNTQQFFSDVVTGEEKFKPLQPWTPLLSFTGHEQAFGEIYQKFNGNFDAHIATSIPTFRETQIKVGAAIVEGFSDQGTSMLDIGGSEGGLVKAITSASQGRIKTINLDPNSDMQAAFNKSPVKGSTFVKEAYLEGFDDIPAHTPKNKVDIIHESMTFQFIDNKRRPFIKELVSKYIKPDGLFLTEEKLIPESEAEFLANEMKKDRDYKSKYYTLDQISTKAENVLVGMKKNQVAEMEYVKILNENFKYVVSYWNSGNFKGYAASNSREKIDRFMQALGGEITSEFSSTAIKNDSIVQSPDLPPLVIPENFESKC